MDELLGQCTARGLEPEFIVHACGSGGTTAGLVAGAQLAGFGGRLIAFAVCDDRAYFRAKVSDILDGMGFYPLGDHPPVGYEVDDRYKGIGYAVSQPEELQFIAHVARLEGLVLDPVYSGKALYGLACEARSGGIPKGSTVVFVHTGGAFGLFPQAAQLATALADDSDA